MTHCPSLFLPHSMAIIPFLYSHQSSRRHSPPSGCSGYIIHHPLSGGSGYYILPSFGHMDVCWSPSSDKTQELSKQGPTSSHTGTHRLRRAYSSAHAQVCTQVRTQVFSAWKALLVIPFHFPPGDPNLEDCKQHVAELMGLNYKFVNRCCRWSFCTPPPTHILRVFGFSHEGGALVKEISALTSTENCLPPSTICRHSKKTVIMH
jgi:hypothetical protein